MPPSRSELRLALALALATAALGATVALGGCGEARRAPAPEAEPCARIGDRCRLPEGPVGVCNVTTAPCDDPPCLACISQH